MKTQRVFLFLVLIASLIGIIWVLSAREPRYQGRTLTRWLQQYHFNSLDQTQRIQEAQNAIRGIGAQKALPKLLNLVETRDDPVSLSPTRSLHAPPMMSTANAGLKAQTAGGSGNCKAARFAYSSVTNFGFGISLPSIG
jgi:hypothetical protein